MKPAVPSGRRDRAIDLFKGLLVLGMVYCHVLQFFSDPQVYPSGQRWIEFINLITFSGFVFSFGYASQLAYYAKPFRQAAPRMVKTAVKTLLAFYISGTAFRLFIDGRVLDWGTIRPILLLKDMPGWSEFLASFTYLILLGMILFHPLRLLVERKWAGFAAAGLLLVTTWLPYGSFHVPQLAPLVGTRDFASFPVLPYFPYYIVGMLFARHRIVWDLRVLAGSAAASGAFVWKWLQAGGWPERFPPSIWWILGPALALYGYVLLARLLDRLSGSLTPLEAMGRNVLWFLVMSNMLIFALKNNRPDLLIDPYGALWMEAALLGVAGFGVWVVTKPRRSEMHDQAFAGRASLEKIESP